jgi:hypothetical protein
MQAHPVVSHDQWIAARKALLAQEKELTRARDGEGWMTALVEGVDASDQGAQNAHPLASFRS